MKYILLASDTESCSIPAPQYGYSTDIVMALKIGRNQYSGDINSWDNGIANDYRICDAKWLLTQSEMSDLHTFLASVDGGRNNDFTLTFDSGSGSYLFGPDIGITSGFRVVEIKNSRSSRMLRPHGMFEFSCKLLMITSGGTVLPTKISQGGTTIGTVTGVPFIKDIDLQYTKGWNIDISNSGDPNYIDLGIHGQYSDSAITFEGKIGVAAAVVNHIQSVVRGNQFNITTDAVTYLFGAENSSTGSFGVKLTDNVIRVEHGAPDRFKITLNVHLE